jgi:hypothetical protein
MNVNNTQAVNSTLIQKVGYNPLNEQLSIVFKASPQTTYNYSGVSRSTANQLIEADSKGQFFNSNIRGRFPTTKVAL